MTCLRGIFTPLSRSQWQRPWRRRNSSRKGKGGITSALQFAKEACENWISISSISWSNLCWGVLFLGWFKCVATGFFFLDGGCDLFFKYLNERKIMFLSKLVVGPTNLAIIYVWSPSSSFDSFSTLGSRTAILTVGIWALEISKRNNLKSYLLIGQFRRKHVPQSTFGIKTVSRIVRAHLSVCPLRLWPKIYCLMILNIILPLASYIAKTYIFYRFFVPQKTHETCVYDLFYYFRIKKQWAHNLNHCCPKNSNKFKSWRRGVRERIWLSRRPPLRFYTCFD